jgi:hypothetical protein
MTYAIVHYLRYETAPRLREVVSGSDFVLAVMLGAGFAIWGGKVSLAEMKVEDITTILLTYAAIAFGFCLSGLTLALTLPDRAFAQELALAHPKQNGPNSYSNLMFIYSWTAIIHWLVIVASIGILVFSGSDQKILPSNASPGRHLVVGLLIFLSAYGVFRFLVALITLSQVGTAYISNLSKAKGSSG